MKKLILLTYSFPPLSSGGTPVVLNMCRYLPLHDWQVTVVTVSNPKGMKIDNTLLDEIPEDLKVIRVAHGKSVSTTQQSSIQKKSALKKLLSFVVHNYILIPDRVITWKKQVLPVLDKIIQEEKPHVIMSFGPHHSLHLIAFSAAKKTALPVIPFFGDLWMKDSNVQWPSRINKFIESLLEKSVIHRARGIIATTERSTGYFLDRYPHKCPPTHVAENAYDPRRYNHRDSTKSNKEYLIAGWTGNFFASHSPEPLLEGLKMFYSRNPHSKLRIKMAGGIDHVSLKKINQEPLKGKVTHSGHLEWAKVPEFQNSCDILIGFLTSRKGSELKNSSKTAEYLISGKTILGLVPEGAMATRIREYGNGYIVQPYSEDIALKLENLEYQWKTSTLRKPLDFDKIEEKFSAVRVMARMADFLNKLVGP